MNYIKKLSLTAFILLLALSQISASTLSTRKVKIAGGANYDANLGRSGVALIGSYYSGELILARKDGVSAKTPKMNFVAALLDARFTAPDGSRITRVHSPVYVYFKVAKTEIGSWKKGLLSIYYFEPWTNSWKVCPTTLVEADGDRRLVCRIGFFGLYGLAKK
ncbi:MAG TPA: hypothetical protein VF498_07795 [Anaerolineales bacterium]